MKFPKVNWQTVYEIAPQIAKAFAVLFKCSKGKHTYLYETDGTGKCIYCQKPAKKK